MGRGHVAWHPRAPAIQALPETSTIDRDVHEYGLGSLKSRPATFKSCTRIALAVRPCRSPSAPPLRGLGASGRVPLHARRHRTGMFFLEQSMTTVLYPPRVAAEEDPHACHDRRASCWPIANMHCGTADHAGESLRSSGSNRPGYAFSRDPTIASAAVRVLGNL
jgi:hypothetical protein